MHQTFDAALEMNLLHANQAGAEHNREHFNGWGITCLNIMQGTVHRSYTPHTEGDIPAIVMEFLSRTDSGEHSLRPTYPYGKMWFYEQIVKIPVYVTFDTESRILEVRRLQGGTYAMQQPDAQGCYFLPEIGLFLGVWDETRLETTAHWLRWWDESGNLLLWGAVTD